MMRDNQGKIVTKTDLALAKRATKGSVDRHTNNI
jgi:hypothetical protein